MAGQTSTTSLGANSPKACSRLFGGSDDPDLLQTLSPVSAVESEWPDVPTPPDLPDNWPGDTSDLFTVAFQINP